MLVEAPLNLLLEDANAPYPLPLAKDEGDNGLTNCLFVFAPAIREARERVRRGARELAMSYSQVPFDPGSVDEILASSLAQQIFLMMGRVLVLELNVARLEGLLPGNTPEERFQSFVARLREPVFAEQMLAEYPVLMEQVVNRLDKWAAFSLEFLEHLCDDWTALRQSLLGPDPGMLVGVQTGAGDTHRHGRSVIIASFSGRATLVYKPHSLAVDEHFQELLTWLNEHGAQPQFQTMRILNRQDHGWTEFIRSKRCASEAELSRFYERMGSCLAILHVLNGADFHYENLIASGEHPFLIDLEGLFHQQIEDSSQRNQTGAYPSAHTVLRVSLLPSRFGFSKDYAGVDLGGLSNPAGQLSPGLIPFWDATGTDEMRLIRKRAAMPAAANVPGLEGQEVSAFDYADAIAAGFSSTYRLLLKHRDDVTSVIESFSQDEVRVIARGTQTYGTLLAESFHPDILRDSADRRALFERLREGAENHPLLSRLLPAECNDLLRGDIPLFTTRPGSRDLWTSDGERIDGAFSDTAIDLVRRQIFELSEEDLGRQLWIIRASIATLSTQSAPEHGPTHRGISASLPAAAELTSEALLSTARAVGDRIAALAFDKNEVAWLGVAIANGQQRYLTPLGIDLYDGLPGVILFLAYLDAVSGQSRYSGLVRSGVKSLQRQIDASGTMSNIGGFAGWGGVLYSLAHLGVIRDDSSLLASAESLLDRIGEGIASDNDLDIISGSAGCALAVRSLRRVRPSARTTEIARACGERLLAGTTQTEHGIGWLCGETADPPLTGFAHGNAGIAYALLAISEMTGEARFETAACKAIDYERALYSPEHGNWPDLRSHSRGSFATAWCHGAPGIGLSRVCSLGYLQDPVLKEEIDTALSTTLLDGFGGSDSLCHGDLGNVDILLHAAEILDEPRWKLHARKESARVVAAARHAHSGALVWNCGHPLGVESPGLMTGLAGIGYALLRLADPGRVPCILALEPPRVV